MDINNRKDIKESLKKLKAVKKVQKKIIKFENAKRNIEEEYKKKKYMKSYIQEKMEIKRALKKNKIKSDTYPKNGKKKLPWFTYVPLICTMAISAISGYISDKNNVNKIEKNTNIITDDNEIQNTTKSNIDSENNRETFSKPDGETIQRKDIEEAVDNYNKEKIKINDKINVKDGIKYTADCLGGGNHNLIGAISWRPSAEYYIDRAAFCYEGKILGILDICDSSLDEELTRYAKQYDISEEDIDISVLISLVSGIGDTGWISTDIENLQQNKVKSNINNKIEKNHNLYSIDIER